VDVSDVLGKDVANAHRARLGYDKRTFECTQCKFTMTETVRYR
jgi:hypothetical protein